MVLGGSEENAGLAEGLPRSSQRPGFRKSTACSGNQRRQEAARVQEGGWGGLWRAGEGDRARAWRSSVLHQEPGFYSRNNGQFLSVRGEGVVRTV